MTCGHQELGLAQHLRSLAAHQGAVLALHSVSASSRTKHVVGIVVAEAVQQADLIKSSKVSKLSPLSDTTESISTLLGQSSAANDPNCDSAIRIETPLRSTFLGVAVMWVHAGHRRKGLAQHMISVACTQPSGMFFQFIGCTSKQVAFLAPTDDGSRFASRLRGDGHVLQYSLYEDASTSAKRSAEPQD
jgi:hypothetical protein